MKLGFHYHIPAIKKESSIYLPGYIGRFLDSLASECEFLTCFLYSPLDSEISLMDYPLCNNNISLVNIGLHASVPKRLICSGRIKKIIRKYCKNLDLLLVRGPSPLLPVVSEACENLPTSLLIVGDYLAGVDDLPQPRWRKELIRIWSIWNSQRQFKIAERSLTFVNSHLLYQQFEGKIPNLIETKTTTLSINDFYLRNDTCIIKPIQLLYTGRIDRAKGLLDILEAMNILVVKGVDIDFNIVGMKVQGDLILDEILTKSKEYGLLERVKYHGYYPLGPDLFKFYKLADIYIIASQASEGFPRTIWEAMAHSLPVIATRVGSIPDYVEGAASLVNPRSPQELSNAISKILSDQEYRKKIIQNGFQLAKQNTLDIRAKEMIASMERYVEQFSIQKTL